MQTTFSLSQLDSARRAYFTIETVNSDMLANFHRIFDGCEDAALTQLAKAGIKFVSKLAINACVRRNIAI